MAKTGGSGISVHNAHAKGQIILTAGCDPTLLQNSTCFEINPDMTKRAAQTAFSESLWKAHQDFLQSPMEERGSFQCHHLISPSFARL